MKPGHIYTVAGSGHPGASHDAVPAAQAPLALASGAAVDPAGNVVVAGEARLLVIAASPNLFRGVRMLPWRVYGAGTAS